MICGHSRGDTGFNPLPSPKRGETQYSLFCQCGYLQFQSAPLTEARGDSSDLYLPSLYSEFQSAPLTEARGDSNISKTQSVVLRFQSAPLTEASGDRSIPWDHQTGM